MENYRIVLRFIVPIVAIIMGFVIKKSNSPKFEKYKNYWYWFVIVGTVLLVFRLYNYFL